MKNQAILPYSPDVIVVGGGPAGIGAALGAAGTGAKVLLIERHGFFGGIGAFCVGMPINQVRPNGQPRSRIHEAVVGKLLAYGDQAVRLGQHELWCNVEYLKVAVLDALDEAKCQYLVHAQVADVLVSDGRVSGVVVATKSGLVEIPAKVVVDCTGDADVAFFADAETMKEEGSLSPATLCFSLTGVTDVKQANKELAEVCKKAREKYPLVPDRWGLCPISNSRSVFINHAGTRDMGQFDDSNPVDLSKAECLSRRQVIQMTQAMREFGGEALRDIEIVGAGPQIGVRETRRLKGLYILTEDDAKSGRSFPDAVAWRSGFLDIGFVRFERMKVHDVPYRSLVPEKMDGLLVAGRCISASHVAASAGKSMGNCMATGHAAGLAAAMSADQNIQPRNLDIDSLRQRLQKDGVDLNRAGDAQENVR